MLKCGHAAMEKGTKQRNNKKLKNKICNVVFKFLFSKNTETVTIGKCKIIKTHKSDQNGG